MPKVASDTSTTVNDEDKSAGPYGFTAGQWAEKSEVEKQVVRNFAYQEAIKKYGDTEKLPPELLGAHNAVIAFGNQQNVQYFDAKFGGFIYNTGTKKWLSNTWNATHPGEFESAAAQIADRQRLLNQSEEMGTRSYLSRLGRHANSSYSGCDITPSVTIGDKTFVLGNVSTLSYSIHRGKPPVRTLGRAYPKSYVSSSRTIAGTIIFTVFDSHALHELRTAVIAETEATGRQSSPLSDQIPPFDITIVYQNEYGYSSYMRIYGVEITDEGQTHSINDIYSENVMQYVARDIDLMTRNGDIWTPQALAASNTFNKDLFVTPATRLLKEQQGAQTQLDKDLATAIGQLARTKTFQASFSSSDSQYTLYQNVIDQLEKEIATMEQRKKRLGSEIEESTVLHEDTVLGGSSSVFHDSPYNMTRKKL